MISFPNAKINLGLNVVTKRDDGYHEIRSIIYPIEDLCDILEIIKSDEFSFSLSGDIMMYNLQEEKNICVKAYNLLKDDFNLGNVKIHLHKRIKIGAGLGGGSSDGAFTLMMLNDLFDLKLSASTLKSYALMLGSDCPFFIENTPQYVTGIGEKMDKVNLDLKSYEFKFFFPDVFVSTKEAYSSIKPKKSLNNLLDVILRPVSAWKGLLKNDFEIPVFNKYPKLQNIKNNFYKDGAIYSSMTGSGSVVYGIYEK